MYDVDLNWQAAFTIKSKLSFARPVFAFIDCMLMSIDDVSLTDLQKAIGWIYFLFLWQCLKDFYRRRSMLLLI